MFADELRPMETVADPETAVDRLASLHTAATGSLRDALNRFLAEGVPPDSAERLTFRYPELRLTYRPTGPMPRISRATAKFQGPGVFSTTLTQPGHFRPYLLEQLRPLVQDYGATIEVGLSAQEIPYPYVVEPGAELARGVTSSDLARHFPTPMLSSVGDEIADGLWLDADDEVRPLALFDGPRVDYSLRRLVHYTGADWRQIQPWILLTNYHRYVDQFVRVGLKALVDEPERYARLVLPGGVSVEAGEAAGAQAEALIAASPWHRFQMPAYHLVARTAKGSRAGDQPRQYRRRAVERQNHHRPPGGAAAALLADGRPLRGPAPVADHRRLRAGPRLPAPRPDPRRVGAARRADPGACRGPGRAPGGCRQRHRERAEALKQRLRTGTVVTYDDRNWELRWSQERRRINLSRAIGVDMESGTIAAQGYRLRVPYGTLLCVSDKPLHGEIKLPGAANAFYERAVGEHLLIGLATLDALRRNRHGLHSRKLRSFDEPPFR